jgi:hypothetical protein
MTLKEAGEVIDQAIVEIEDLRRKNAELHAVIQDLHVAWLSPDNGRQVIDCVEKLIAIKARQVHGS